MRADSAANAGSGNATRGQRADLRPAPWHGEKSRFSGGHTFSSTCPSLLICYSIMSFVVQCVFFFLPGCKTFSLHASFFLILCEFYTSFFKVLFIPGCKVFPLVLIFWFSVNSRSFAVLLFILTVSKNQLLRIFFCFCAISLYLALVW